MVHEYQFEVIPEVSKEGQALFAQYQLSPEKPKPNTKGFVGKGHDEVFYTSVEIFARYLGVTGEKLITDGVRHI